MKKLIFGVLAGLITTVVLSITTDILMYASGIYPPVETEKFNYDNKLLLIASVYRAIYGILGGFIAAIIAKEKYKKAVIILGSIGILLSLIGLIAMWGKSAPWYPVSLIVLSLPYTLVGGQIYKKIFLKNS